MTTCFLSVTMDGKEYKVDGKYFKAVAASWYAPSEPEMFVIHDVYNDNLNIITSSVTHEQWGELEILCIQAYHDQDELAREESAVAKYEEN